MTQIQGPGSPQTMSPGPVEPHEEPPTIGADDPTELAGLPQAKYVVARGQEAAGDDGEQVNALLEVLYQGDDLDAATAAFDDADAGNGFVQMLADGTAIEAKRAAAVLTDPGAAPEPGEGEQASAFDTGKFTPTRPQVNEEDADKIQISFSGVWELDPMNEDDVAFWNRLHFGQSLDLQVEAEIVGVDGKYKRGAEDEETITGVAKAKIIHAHRLTPAEL